MMKTQLLAKYALLTPLGRAEKKPVGKRSRWFEFCLCDCGKELWVLRDNLRSGNTTSCGCHHLAKVSEMGRGTRTHGLSQTRVYYVWRAILYRCTNPSHEVYHRYGGRGIRIDPTWHTIEGFVADMGHPPTERHEIDRIDNDGHYTKSNCRWVTRQQNARNRSDNRLITHQGVTRCLSEWAEITGIKECTIRYRIAAGWPIDKALLTPVMTVHGEPPSACE